MSKRLVKEDGPNRSILVAAAAVGLLFSLSWLLLPGRNSVFRQGSPLQQAREVPALASAQSYYRQGLSYKAMGWTEQARRSLNKAIEMDRNGETGRKAERYLLTRIPIKPVCREAEQRNILGYNLMMSNKNEQAEQTFKELIVQYPDFEWSYGNLSGMYLDSGKPEEAERLARQALAINPHYFNARVRLAFAEMAQGAQAAAEEDINSALEDDPDDPYVKQALAQLKRLQSDRRSGSVGEQQ